MPVLLTVSAAAEEMLMIRPRRRCFMPGTTARVHRNALVRLASTTACQSCSETSSSGWPTWPTTPPALLTRMSTSPAAAKNARDLVGVGQVGVGLVDAGHGGPVGAQRRGDGGPDAVGGPGHDRGPPGQPARRLAQCVPLR